MPGNSAVHARSATGGPVEARARIHTPGDRTSRSTPCRHSRSLRVGHPGRGIGAAGPDRQISVGPWYPEDRASRRDDEVLPGPLGLAFTKLLQRAPAGAHPERPSCLRCRHEPPTLSSGPGGSQARSTELGPAGGESLIPGTDYSGVGALPALPRHLVIPQVAISFRSRELHRCRIGDRSGDHGYGLIVLQGPTISVLPTRTTSFPGITHYRLAG